MPTLSETTHPGGFLVWEAFRDYTREVVTIAAGDLSPGCDACVRMLRQPSSITS